MPTPRCRPYSPSTRISVRVLGEHLQVARRKRRMSAHGLAERLGASRSTIHRMESGDTRVAIGLYFEACFILGIPLWEDNNQARDVLSKQLRETLALLPGAPRTSIDGDQDGL